mgnify:CR=1 FL=1
MGWDVLNEHVNDGPRAFVRKRPDRLAVPQLVVLRCKYPDVQLKPLPDYQQCLPSHVFVGAIATGYNSLDVVLEAPLGGFANR